MFLTEHIDNSVLLTSSASSAGMMSKGRLIKKKFVNIQVNASSRKSAFTTTYNPTHSTYLFNTDRRENPLLAGSLKIRGKSYLRQNLKGNKKQQNTKNFNKPAIICCIHAPALKCTLNQKTPHMQDIVFFSS